MVFGKFEAWSQNSADEKIRDILQTGRWSSRKWPGQGGGCRQAWQRLRERSHTLISAERSPEVARHHLLLAPRSARLSQAHSSHVKDSLKSSDWINMLVFFFLLLLVVWHARTNTLHQSEDKASRDADLRSFLTVPCGLFSFSVQMKLFHLLSIGFVSHQFWLLTLFLVTVITGGSAGVSNRLPPIYWTPGRPRASSCDDGCAIENGIIGSKGGTRVRGVMPDHWELAFSDPGEQLYIEWVSVLCWRDYWKENGLTQLIL